MGAHADELGNVHEAVLEHGLGEDAPPGPGSMSAMNWACMSVGKPGCGEVVTSIAAQPAQALDARAPSPSRSITRPALRSLTTTGSRSSSGACSSSTSPPASADRGHEGAGFDAIRDHGVVERLELFRAVDVDGAGAGALHPRAHLVEHPPQLLDLGLARAVDERGAALGQRGRHHQVLGAADGRHVEHDFRAAQALGSFGQDEAVLDLNLGAERLEPLQVLVDRACADLRTRRAGKPWREP